MPVPSAPTAVHTVVGDRIVQVRWGKPTDNGGHAITGYVIRAYTNSDDKFVKLASVNATTFAANFDKLSNGTAYYFRVHAINSSGNSIYAQSATVTPTSGATSVIVTITRIGPDKVPNTRPGQSLADAPTLTVHGTNLAQVWGADPQHKLEWQLGTSTSFATLVGSGGPIRLQDIAAGHFTISSPVAPAGADVDSNHLIGPWRLKATYTPDPTGGGTAVAYSPVFYTTAVGTVVIGTASPTPLHDGDLVTLTGPDIGVCDSVVAIIGGNAIETDLTMVDQDTATFVMPTYGYQTTTAGTLQVKYKLNGNVLTSGTFPVIMSADPVDTGGDSTYVPPTGADIPTGEQPYPVIVQRWVFTCPATGETYTVPRNPDQMTSPFATRTVSAKFTSAVSGKALLTEGAPALAQWQFGGTCVDAAHYEKLRHWVNDINSRVTITDHYGRVITCVLTFFDAKPRRDMHRYWSHTYQITAMVIDVGEPTQVPAA